MKTFIKVLGIISITLASLILFKFVNIIIGITFFIIGIGLFFYFEFITKKDIEKQEISNPSYKDLNKSIQEYTKLLNKKCEIPYDLFYINMDKNLDRKKNMEDQLKNINVNFHRIKGLDGSNIENGKIDGVNFKNNFKNNFDFSNSNMGCTLSHLKAVKTAYDYNLDIAIICEDDVNFITCTLNPDIKYIISNSPKDWEIIQLITQPYTQKNNNTDKYVKRHPQTYFSTACYAINRIGMKKIIDYSYIDKDQTFVLNNTKLTPSGVADYYIYDIVKTYSYFPNIFSVNNTELESTIHQTHSASHIKNSLNYLNTFSKQIKFS